MEYWTYPIPTAVFVHRRFRYLVINILRKLSAEYTVMAECSVDLFAVLHLDGNHFQSNSTGFWSVFPTPVPQQHTLCSFLVVLLSSSTNFGCPVLSTPCLIAPTV